LTNIIKRSWSEDIPIVEIANAFPQFLNESHSNAAVGRFHLGHCMSLKTWDSKENMKLFNCQEIDPQNPKFFRDRALVVTHSMILQLETNSSYPDLAHLVSYASLFSLLTVKVAKSDHKKLTFEWRIPEGVSALAQQFRINEAEEFIRLLLNNSERLGITFDRKNLRPQPSISEDEVTAQALKKIKIQEIMDGIVKFEVAIQDDMNKENVDKLIDLYQRAIEYYSALNDPKFETYLQKVRKLLSDEVVLDVLAGKPPPKKQIVKEEDKKAVKMFEDLEIWPSGPPADRPVSVEGTFLIKKDEDVDDEIENENSEFKKDEEKDFVEDENSAHQEKDVEMGKKIMDEKNLGIHELRLKGDYLDHENHGIVQHRREKDESEGNVEKEEKGREKNEEIREKNEEIRENNEEIREKNEEIREKNEELSEKNEENLKVETENKESHDKQNDSKSESL
jgi:hypothetical protein